ncbi:MAG: EamA family transporter [Bacillota bacterium]
MLSYVWPILVVIGANTFYHIAAKSTPGNINPFATLTVTYLTAALLSVILFCFSGSTKNLFDEVKSVNWTSFILGFAIVGLEFGYLQVYRVGWNVSTGSLVANIGLAVTLIFIGALLYKETITPAQLAGIALCIAGMVLINK